MKEHVSSQWRSWFPVVQLHLGQNWQAHGHGSRRWNFPQIFWWRKQRNVESINRGCCNRWRWDLCVDGCNAVVDVLDTVVVVVVGAAAKLVSEESRVDIVSFKESNKSLIVWHRSQELYDLIKKFSCSSVKMFMYFKF